MIQMNAVNSVSCSLKQIFKMNQIILNFYYNSVKIILKKMIYNYI